MEPLDFCLLFNRLEKKTGFQLDSSIVFHIYSQYRGTYANYTLFELVDMLECKGVGIDCPLNKKLIIDMIERKKIPEDVIPKQDLSIALRRTEWFACMGLCLRDYVIFSNTSTYMGMCHGDVVCMGDDRRFSISDIYVSPPTIHFGDGLAFDVSEIYRNVPLLTIADEMVGGGGNVVTFEDGSSFDICDIYNLVNPLDGISPKDYMLVVDDIDTKQKITFRLKDFIDRLDEEDVTYEKHCFNIRHAPRCV
jgi:hypothetical protein